MNVEPEPIEAPPVAFAYHEMVDPVDPVAPIVAEPAPHLAPGVVVITLLLNTTCIGVEIEDNVLFVHVT